MRAAELLGPTGVITGIQPAVARTMTSLGVEMAGIMVRANLREGLWACLAGLESKGARRRSRSQG